jgi:hypothetical protein
MAILKNTTITGTGQLVIPKGPIAARAQVTTSIISWTNTGTQAVSVLAGPTPTLSSTSWTAPTGVTRIEVLVVAGGGGGGNRYAGGGGAGGLIYNSAFSVSPGTSYTVTVGAGGAGGTAGNGRIGQNGSNSVFGSLTAIGGGGGGDLGINSGRGYDGGSGGGVSIFSSTAGQGTAGQGFPGGISGVVDNATNGNAGAGGGGAGGPGSRVLGAAARDFGAGGGIGLNFNISGTPTWYAGGGGGGTGNYSDNGMRGGVGGLGGGGAGGSSYLAAPAINGTNGTVSTGGGGGGGGGNNATSGGTGGSGIVIIKYTTASTNESPTGNLRFNTQINDIETYENSYTEWVSQDPQKNYAGHNLFLASQDLSNVAWQKDELTVSTNTTRAPDGTLTADSVIENSANAFHRILTAGSNLITATGNTTYAFSVFVKRIAGTRHIFFMTQNGINGIYAHFDMTNNVVHNSGASGTGRLVSAGITSIGNDWYRISITGVVDTATATVYNQIYFENALNTGFGATGPYTGDGTSAFATWNWQCERADAPGPAVRTDLAASPTPTKIAGYQIHTYTTVGTSGFTPAVSGFVDVLVVAGGGGGGQNAGSGGGGGGVIEQTMPVIANQQYTVTVGAGGIPNSGSSTVTSATCNGGNSVFGPLVAVGGGAGIQTGCGIAGGSGGGGANGGEGLNGSRGGGNVAKQGNPGGTGLFEGGVPRSSGGGGGAGERGADTFSTGEGGRGGNGKASTISGSLQYYAGGGGGSAHTGSTTAVGGLGGGGNGGFAGGPGPGNGVGSNGVNGTGGGAGGGSGGGVVGGTGGSGIVIVRYRCD